MSHNFTYRLYIYIKERDVFFVKCEAVEAFPWRGRWRVAPDEVSATKLLVSVLRSITLTLGPSPTSGEGR